MAVSDDVSVRFDVSVWKALGAKVDGPTYHPKGCKCGQKSLCDGSGTMPVYAITFEDPTMGEMVADALYPRKGT